MQLPAEIGDYTDFYASIHHATNVGRLFRPDNPLLPNYRWMPIAYHGRASLDCGSGTRCSVPAGSGRRHQPSDRRDRSITNSKWASSSAGERARRAGRDSSAEDQIFGVCLVNDWSARDMQAWEYQPLGPFLGKSFATSISPWVVDDRGAGALSRSAL